MKTKNFGLKKGWLDNTKQWECGARALCNQSELRAVGLKAGPVTISNYGQSGFIGGVPAPKE